MGKITMFTMAACPYCRNARRWMKELLEENPSFSSVETEIIDEVIHPIKAAKYDYYYVPTYYVDNEKLHEGIPTKDIIRSVYRMALGE